ncbi:hypothetical protein CDBH8_0076 [Corynebacterium diphtheriae BH8]|nr:hypothetical protein CD31A_0073 [Corynebacterium diphtheriae 31A]AEX47603.1 hypothetical protein CDBH8_0076 [Corynebacterium diphtheriae BH8]AEX68747.1 hypothetical protein CDPW8_0068 [Corynebacterium diphtheriae PW8]AEX75573.1 hypothetical protein CDHC02_0075 [Corynebacterium diphtheriae HC02]
MVCPRCTTRRTDKGSPMSACGPSVVDVITCVVHYTIDPDQIAAFEQFARA